MSMSDGRSSRSPEERIKILADDCGLTDNLPLVTHSSLEELETVIESGKLAYIAVGNALREIRDRKLYRQTHKTFEVYCRERWDLCRSSAYDYIKAANVGTTLQSQGEEAPEDVKAALAVVEPPKKVKAQVPEIEEPTPVPAPTYPKSKTKKYREETEAWFKQYGLPATVTPANGDDKLFDVTLRGLTKDQIERILCHALWGLVQDLDPNVIAPTWDKAFPDNTAVKAYIAANADDIAAQKDAA